MDALCVSITDAAKALAIGRTTAYELVKAGEIPTVKLKGRKVVPIAALEALVKKAS